MKRRNKQVRAYSLGGLLLVIVLIGIILLLVFGGVAINLDGCEGTFPSAVSVYAESAPDIVYSDVLEDLSKDPDFDASAYPSKQDYKLEIVQLAESSSGELFVYVYQPIGARANATEIRFSTAINDGFKPVDYKLELLSASYTLFKYKVQGFAVKADAVRYYDVVCIFRKYISGVDSKPIDGQTVGSVSYEVGKLWTACTADGKVTYGLTETETILITDKVCGFLRLNNGLGDDYSDSHYVAFSTDKPIDKLMEADVSYLFAPYSYSGSSRPTTEDIVKLTEGKETEESITLTADKTEENSANGLFGRKYTWHQIEPVATFKMSHNLSSSAANALEGKNWVLRFALTDRHELITETIVGIGINPRPHYVIRATYVSNVTVLRLKFETDGKVYNLGVVDNKQSGSGEPSDIPDKPDKNDAVPWWERMSAAFKSVGSWFSRLWQNSTARKVIIVLACIVGGALVISFLGWLIKKFK